MWYVVDILFAQRAKEGHGTVKCEHCSVLFEAPSAIDACRKATPWAEEHSQDAGFQVLGIRHVRSLEEERPGDGTEVAGWFFDEEDPWGRKEDLIPELVEIPTIKFEQHPDVPIRELLSKEQQANLEKDFNDIIGEH